jgi:NitT/TauT family transport system ATP-binding protein
LVETVLERQPREAARAAAPPSVALRAVTMAFGDFVAVRDVSLTVTDGEFLAVVGPTGCGKSTILNAIAGLLQPAAGDVELLGRMVSGLSPEIGYLFQQDALLPWKTALDNIAMGPIFRGTSRAEARTQAQDWLAKVGLAAFAGRYPHQLSGGQKKRVQMAQALINGPQVILMDEPFSALDVHTRHLMQNELLRLWQEQRRAVVFITHDLEEAIALSDRVLVLSAGPASRPVAEFPVSLPRPRDVAEIKLQSDFLDLYRQIWSCLRSEVEKSHGRQA